MTDAPANIPEPQEAPQQAEEPKPSVEPTQPEKPQENASDGQIEQPANEPEPAEKTPEQVESTDKGLTAQEWNEIIEKAEKICPDSLALIGIYGSVATGDDYEKSDLDLLILIQDMKIR